MDGGGYRVEAQRWLTISEKLLAARDLSGAKSFAIRSRESDPRLQEFADQIIAVSDTISASELRVNGNSYDYYAILQLGRLTQSMDLVAAQYRKLALLLNPNRNRLPFADQAFRLVSEAWLVFSDPSKKAMYDHELQMNQFVQLGPLGQLNQQQFVQFGHQGSEVLGFQLWSESGQSSAKKGLQSGVNAVASGAGESSRPIRPVSQWKTPPPKPAPESTRPVSQPHFTVTASNSAATSNATSSAHFAKSVEPTPPDTSTEPAVSAGVEVDAGAESAEPDVPSFWTTCPYCFNMYEYQQVYEDCALRCQNCKRAFQAVAVPAPPVTGKDTYFCCWGYFPLGGKVRGNRGWSPFSAMFATPLQAGGQPANYAKQKVVYKDDLFRDLSESSNDDDDSDDDWGSTRKKTRGSVSGRGRGRGAGSPNRNVRKMQSDWGKKGDNLDAGVNSQVAAELLVAKKGEGSISGKRKGAKNLGKLDLNVMCSNEVEDAVPGISEGNETGDGGGGGGEDNIEGIGFFEGLDEFLSSLPILSGVGDDKVKAT